jgi:protein tyrosine phosphatase (PTP) superfamily phosphohydrolase (DUF442 family)
MLISLSRNPAEVLPHFRSRAKSAVRKRLPWTRWLRARRSRVALALLLLLAVAWWQVPVFLENFSVVIPACAYRSSQLTAGALKHYVEAYGIHSVINLRGRNPECPWYWEEREAASQLGLRHYDLAVDSRYPYAEEVREVIETLETCPRPVLFHCNAGVDRTGTVAAIALLLLEEHATLADAEGHFGLRYLQVPWRNNAIGQRYFLDLYRQWLSQQNQPHSPTRFRYWALHCYERPPEEPPSPDQR